MPSLVARRSQSKSTASFLGFSVCLAFFAATTPAVAGDKVVPESSIGKRLEGKWRLDKELTKSLNRPTKLEDETIQLFEFKLADAKKNHLPKGWEKHVVKTKFLSSPEKLKLIGDGATGKKKAALAIAEGKIFLLYIVPNYGVASIHVSLVRASDKKKDLLFLRHSFGGQTFTFAYKRKK